MSDYKAGLRAAVNRGARAAEREYKTRNPEAAGLRVKSAIATYKPRSKEVRDLGVRAVALFLYEPETRGLSNAALALKLGQLVGAKVPANILTERFSDRQIGLVEEHLKLSGVSLDLATHHTASKIKIALNAIGKSASAHLKCTVTVTFADDVVTVGDRAYRIQRGGGTPRIHVGAKKLNVDVLKALLTGSQ